MNIIGKLLDFSTLREVSTILFFYFFLLFNPIIRFAGIFLGVTTITFYSFFFLGGGFNANPARLGKKIMIRPESAKKCKAWVRLSPSLMKGIDLWIKPGLSFGPALGPCKSLVSSSRD